MTNILWMQPGGAVIQLMPYGWHDKNVKPPNPPPASLLFQQLTANANASYFLWNNVRPEHAFLGKAQYEGQVRFQHQELFDMHGACMTACMLYRLLWNGVCKPSYEKIMVSGKFQSMQRPACNLCASAASHPDLLRTNSANCNVIA